MTQASSAEFEELARELHAANERFDAARVEWERWLDASEYRHEERIAHARQELGQAERGVLAIEEKIAEALHPN